MLRLNLKKEPYWIELPASVRVKVRPLTTAVMSTAQSQVIKQIITMREERKADPLLPDVDDEQTRLGYSESLLIKALARASIVEWEGVMQLDSDAVAEITDQTVNDLMDIWFIAQEFWKQYTSALSLLEAEGNESRLAPNGISAAGLDTAESATSSNSHAAEENAAQPQESLALTS
jgi:hypothetical protein